jgi:hypothetical protein
MTIVLLDTNVVSYLFKGDTRATAYAPLLQDHQLAISFMTVAELFEWAATRKWGANPHNTTRTNTRQLCGHSSGCRTLPDLGHASCTTTSRRADDRTSRWVDCSDRPPAPAPHSDTQPERFSTDREP